jgi:ABC-type uncharacterized transport system substrate-binding protein
MKGLLRIVVVVLLGLGPLAAQASVHRVGVLGTSSEDRLRGFIIPQIAKVGLVEGRNLVLDVRTGTAAQLPMLARELLALDVNLIITSGDTATAAAKSVTKTVPIVMFSGDPIGHGLIGSLSHPGGNVTGVSLLAQTLEAKRLELLRDALPKARRIAALLDSWTATDLSGPRAAKSEFRQSRFCRKRRVSIIACQRKKTLWSLTLSLCDLSCPPRTLKPA